MNSIYYYFTSIMKSFDDLSIHKIKKLLFFRTLPENPSRDDLYLVSFPKSGVTWLSFLMATIHLRMSNIAQKVTFFNIEDIIPDIHQSRYINSQSLHFPGYRVIKSHAKYNPFYKKVIYLIRDPRDVMVSYYTFLNSYLGTYRGTFDEFIKSSKFGIKTWCQHVKSWAETPHGTRIWFIRYEDLKKDTEGTLRLLYKHMGYEIPKEILTEALSNGSFNNMQALEELHISGWGYFRYSDSRFIRKGQAGSYKDEMPQYAQELIVKKAGDWMKKFGYI